jgi:hypothetical protein
MSGENRQTFNLVAHRPRHRRGERIPHERRAPFEEEVRRFHKIDISWLALVSPLKQPKWHRLMYAGVVYHLNSVNCMARCQYSGSSS